MSSISLRVSNTELTDRREGKENEVSSSVGLRVREPPRTESFVNPWILTRCMNLSKFSHPPNID